MTHPLPTGISIENFTRHESITAAYDRIYATVLQLPESDSRQEALKNLKQFMLWVSDALADRDSVPPYVMPLQQPSLR